MMSWHLYSVDRYEELQGDWRKLNLEGPNSPLLDPDFVAPLISVFSHGQERLAVCRDDNDLLAMAIVHQVKPGIWETFQPSQSPLGLWVGRPSLALEPALKSLMHSLPGLPLTLGITQQDPALQPRPVSSPWLDTINYIDTARITIAGNFDDYWAARGKNLRHNMRRQRNYLQKNGTTTRLEVSRQPDQIVDAAQHYGQLESAGWKNEGGTAISPDNEQGWFYIDMLQRFSGSGDCSIYRYCYNDVTVAMDMCVHRQGQFIILKTTYDETQTTSSPAALMRYEYFKPLFDEKLVQGIEFYGKLMNWHTKWSDEIRTMYHVNYSRWRLIPILRKFLAFLRRGRQRAA